MIRRAGAGALALCLLALACTEAADQPDPGPACANVAPDASSSACTPLYEPSWDNVFAKTLKPTCARSGASCHASTGRQGGLAFEDVDESYRLLLDTTQVVRRGDAACSVLTARLVSTDPYLRMPPGRALEAGERCAITQWIANGAKR